MSDEHEWMKRHGDYAVRHTTEEEEAEGVFGMRGDSCYLLCRVSTGEVLGEDGGEPEDQILIRAWDWVPRVCDEAEKRGEEKAAATIDSLRREVERLRGALRGLVRSHRALELRPHKLRDFDLDTASLWGDWFGAVNEAEDVLSDASLDEGPQS